LGGLDDAHGVLAGDELVAVCSSIGVAAPEAGKDEGCFPGDEMAAVELGGDVAGEGAVAESLGGVVGIGRCLDEVAAHADEDVGLACVHGLDSKDGVVAGFARRFELENFVEFVVEGGRHFFENAHGAIALDIAVSPDRAEACAFATDGSDEEVEVADFLNGGDGVLVLGESHGPADDEPFFAAQHGAGELLDFGTCNAAVFY